MKQTFSLKYVDWIIIIVSLLFSINAVNNLLSPIEFPSSFLLRIIFALAPTIALISLFLKKMNGERFTRIFVMVSLIIPPILLLNQIFTDFVLYGANRFDLLENPILLFINLVLGIVLLYLVTKHSNQTSLERIKDYGILIILIGVFAIIYVLLMTIQPNMYEELNDYPIWKTCIKSVIGIVIIVFGFRLKNEKLTLKTCLIFVMISLFVYGII